MIGIARQVCRDSRHAATNYRQHLGQVRFSRIRSRPDANLFAFGGCRITKRGFSQLNWDHKDPVRLFSSVSPQQKPKASNDYDEYDQLESDNIGSHSILARDSTVQSSSSSSQEIETTNGELNNLNVHENLQQPNLDPFEGLISRPVPGGNWDLKNPLKWAKDFGSRSKEYKDHLEPLIKLKPGDEGYFEVDDSPIAGVTVVRTKEEAKIVLEKLNQADHSTFHACDTEVMDINLKEVGPVGNGYVTCVSIYSGPGRSNKLDDSESCSIAEVDLKFCSCVSVLKIFIETWLLTSK